MFSIGAVYVVATVVPVVATVVVVVPGAVVVLGVTVVVVLGVTVVVLGVVVVVLGVTVVVLGVVVVPPGVVVAETLSPEALVKGITAKPSGTALRKTIFVLGSYVVNAGSGEAISMNFESGVVAASVPAPFEIVTGPRAVTTPLSSTA
jgi:hypothetical protein